MKRNIKTGLFGLVLCLALAVLGGCSSGRKFEPVTNSLYVSRDGAFSTAFIEAVDESYYTEADMLRFCEEEIKDYNRSKGAPATAYQEEAGKDVTLPVAIESFTYGEKATLILNYASAEDYVAFNEKDESSAHSLMFAAAKNTTGLPDMAFLSVEDGTKIAASSLIGDGKLKIVMIEGALDVQVQGKIVYYSENVTVTGQDTAVTGAEGYSYVVFK